MNVLTFLDRGDVEWTDEMNEELLKIQGIPALLQFLG